MILALLSGVLGGCTGSDWGLSDPDSAALPPVEVDESFVQTPAPELDVLFVVDSTGSMEQEQEAFAAAADSFVASLDEIGLAWQIGVTTMDPDDLGKLRGEPWIITPAADDPVGALEAAVQVGTNGSAIEAGLYAATAAIDSTTTANLGFRRIDAPLHIVMVSDGDDASDGQLGPDPVATAHLILDAEALRTGHAVRVSAVVGTEEDGCSGPYGAALYGDRYLQLVTATGGVAVDICTADFAEVADAVRAYGIEWPTRFTLQADPVDDSVIVEVDVVRQTVGWSIEHQTPALVFDAAPPADAEINVHYDVVSA